MYYKNDKLPTTWKLGQQFNFQIKIKKSEFCFDFNENFHYNSDLISLFFMSAKQKLSSSSIYPAYIHGKILWKRSWEVTALVETVS